MRVSMLFLVISSILIILIASVVFLFYAGGFFGKPRFTRNYETAEYSPEQPFIKPSSITNGLAIYAVGEGTPILVFPYPHAHTEMPMAQDALSDILISLGRKVISFDPPGSFHSPRNPKGDMPEMLQSAIDALSVLGIDKKVDVIGHSMGSLCALAFAITYPEKVDRLILVGGVSGFPAAIKWGYPGSVWKWTDSEYWKMMWRGIRLMNGRGNLELHKKLRNLMGYHYTFNKSFFQEIPIERDDRTQGVPIRYIWNKNIFRKVDYSGDLGKVQAQTLILVGRHDPETSLPCSEELKRGILGSRMIVFEKSGHRPFVEERTLFIHTVQEFLSR